jgi:hypothetical protein
MVFPVAISYLSKNGRSPSGEAPFPERKSDFRLLFNSLRPDYCMGILLPDVLYLEEVIYR